MSKRVLSVGQCQPDHTAISRFLTSHFDVEIEAADREADALDKLRTASFDLILINRQLDTDDSDGLKIIETLQADDALKQIPVMLISNYPESQAEAVTAGATPGFGKLEYDSPETIARVAKFLA